jgi:hypothetical protein
VAYSGFEIYVCNWKKIKPVFTRERWDLKIRIENYLGSSLLRTVNNKREIQETVNE